MSAFEHVSSLSLSMLLSSPRPEQWWNDPLPSTQVSTSCRRKGTQESPVTVQQNSSYPSPSNLGFPQQILPRNKVVSAQSKVEEGIQHI